jgi:hypothetical protein
MLSNEQVELISIASTSQLFLQYIVSTRSTLIRSAHGTCHGSFESFWCCLLVVNLIDILHVNVLLLVVDSCGMGVGCQDRVSHNTHVIIIFFSFFFCSRQFRIAIRASFFLFYFRCVMAMLLYV